MQSFTENDLYRFVYGMILKHFLSTLFEEQVLGLILIFPEDSFLGGIEPWSPVYLPWIQSLTWLQIP